VRTSRLLGCCPPLIRGGLLHCLIGNSETLEAVLESCHPSTVQQLGISLSVATSCYRYDDVLSLAQYYVESQ
jgi:hypothetical protein